MKKLCILIFLCALAFLARTESRLFKEWVEDPEAALLPDFSMAGFASGSMHPPEWRMLQGLPIFDVNTFGAVPDDGESDQWAIQRAIDAAAAAGGGIVKLGSGVYEMAYEGNRSWSLMIRASNIVLVGEGSDKTTLQVMSRMSRTTGPWTAFPAVLFTSPENRGLQLTYGYGQGHPDDHDWYDSTEKPKHSGYYVPDEDVVAKGTSLAPRNTRSITVDSSENIQPGDVLLILMGSKAAAKDLLDPWDPSYFSYLTRSSSPAGSDQANLVRQVVTVQNVAGNQIEFKERLRWEYDPAYDIKLVRYPHIRNVGIMGIRIAGGLDKQSKPMIQGGVTLMNVVEGWVSDVVIYNAKTGLNLTAAKNITVENSVLDRVDGKTADYFKGFHNSFKFLGHTSDCLMRNLKIKRGVTHGFAVQGHANGNVFLNCELPPRGLDGMNSRPDFHSHVPMANLYDNLKNGNLSGSGGNIRTQPHSGPLSVLWNWDSEISGEQKVWKSYKQYDLQMVRPIWVGLTAEDGFRNIQFAENPNYDVNDKVIVESIGQHVEPRSLYEAQLKHRLKREPEAGFFLMPQGPSVVQVGEMATWTVPGAAGRLPIRWMVNGKMQNGTKLNQTFTTPGEVEIIVMAASPMRTIRWSAKKVQVLPSNGEMVNTTGYPLRPQSKNVIRKGNALLQAFFTQNRMGLDLTGDDMILKAETHKRDSEALGGLLVAHLPASGVNAASLSLSIDAEKLEEDAQIYLTVQDADGKWAMSSESISVSDKTFELSGVNWVPLPEAFGLPTAGFTADSVQSLGIAVWDKSSVWAGWKPQVIVRDIIISSS